MDVSMNVPEHGGSGGLEQSEIGLGESSADAQREISKCFDEPLTKSERSCPSTHVLGKFLGVLIIVYFRSTIEWWV